MGHRPFFVADIPAKFGNVWFHQIAIRGRQSSAGDDCFGLADGSEQRFIVNSGLVATLRRVPLVHMLMRIGGVL